MGYYRYIIKRLSSRTSFVVSFKFECMSGAENVRPKNDMDASFA